MSAKSTQTQTSQTHLSIRPEELIDIIKSQKENLRGAQLTSKDLNINNNNFDPITPIRSNTNNPGPLIMKSPGLSPDNVEVKGGIYSSNFRGNSKFSDENNHSLIAADISMLDDLDLSDDDLEGGRIAEGIGFPGLEEVQANDVQSRLFSEAHDLEHDLNQSERLTQMSYLEPFRNDDDKGTAAMNSSMRSLHAMSFLPDTPPHKSSRQQSDSESTVPPLVSSFTPDQTLQKSINRSNLNAGMRQKPSASPAHQLAVTPLRSIMKHHMEEELAGSPSERVRESNRRLIEGVRSKYGSVITDPLTEQQVRVSAHPVAVTSPSSSMESDDLRGELLRANTARNTTPMKRGTGTTSSGLPYTQQYSQPHTHQALHHSMLDDMSFVSGTDADNSRQQTPARSSTSSQPVALTVGGMYTLTIDARGSPMFVPVVDATRLSDAQIPGDNQRAQFGNDRQRDGEIPQQNWAIRDFSSRMIEERNHAPAPWSRRRAQDDSFLSYSEGPTPSMLSYLPDTPQSTGKMRRGGAQREAYGRYSYAAPRYLYSDPPLSSLGEIDERRFPHSAHMAEERADAAWRAEAVATSDQYYYASSKFRPAPMPTFPQHDHWESATDLRSTYPLFSSYSGSRNNNALTYHPQALSQRDYQHLPVANVYSRNISTTLTASSRLSRSTSSRHSSPVRSSRPLFPATPSGAHVPSGISPATLPLSRSGEKQLQPSEYFRDRLEMRDLSASFAGRAGPSTPLLTSR